MDISTGSCLARVVEQIISQYQWFFQVRDNQMCRHERICRGSVNVCNDDDVINASASLIRKHDILCHVASVDLQVLYRLKK